MGGGGGKKEHLKDLGFEEEFKKLASLAETTFSFPFLSSSFTQKYLSVSKDNKSVLAAPKKH